MKLSQLPPKSSGPALAAVMQFVDAEIAKIVADIGATTPRKPAKAPHGVRAKALRHH